MPAAQSSLIYTISKPQSPAQSMPQMEQFCRQVFNSALAFGQQPFQYTSPKALFPQQAVILMSLLMAKDTSK
jgi:hypothetical protein